MPTEQPAWVFGYGSLMWRPGFEYSQRVPATLKGWARKFWQGSPDHRGTAQSPGRVVTLVREEGACCAGVAYKLPAKNIQQIFRLLDLREQGGYTRERLTVVLNGSTSVAAVTWVAHPSNQHYLGPAPDVEIAAHILRAAGPSGTNLDYFLRLKSALASMRAEEASLRKIERLLPRQKFSAGQT